MSERATARRPAAEIRLPTLEGLVEAHAVLLERYGGPPGLRYPEGLESACARPRQLLAYGGEGIGLVEVACSLAVGISQNHPFADGNKRVAFHAMMLTLYKNGHYLDVTDRDAIETMRLLADNRLSEKELCTWATRHLEPL